MYIPKGRWGVRADKLSAQALSHDLVPYLQFLAVLIVNGHGHLHVLGRCLTAFIEIPMDQSHIDVVPHITCVGDRKAKKKKFKKKIGHSRKNKIILFLPKDTLVEPKKTQLLPVSTWHDDLREAHLASHGSGTVHQVGKVLSDVVNVSRQQLQSHPQTFLRWKKKSGKWKKGWEFI